MKRILVVCLGNICRSPIGEGLLKFHADRLNFPIYVDSAGTSGWHSGHPPDPRSIDVMRRNGLDITHQRSRPLTHQDLHTFDNILVMDDQNYRDVQAMGTASAAVQKFVLDGHVPDPYYGGDQGFEKVYDMMNKAAQNWIRKWIQESRD